MPKFQVQEGYAFFPAKSLTPVLPGETVELEHIDEGEQGWKLIPVEEEVQAKDVSKPDLVTLTLDQLQDLAEKHSIDLGKAKGKKEVFALVSAFAEENPEVDLFAEDTKEA